MAKTATKKATKKIATPAAPAKPGTAKTSRTAKPAANVGTLPVGARKAAKVTRKVAKKVVKAAPKPKKVKTFAEGSRVEWSSGASGSVTTKIGTVVKVIAANGDVRDAMRDLERDGLNVSAFGHGSGRDHESYLVRVEGKTSRAKPRVYWPVVAQLAKAKGKRAIA